MLMGDWLGSDPGDSLARCVWRFRADSLTNVRVIQPDDSSYCTLVNDWGPASYSDTALTFQDMSGGVVVGAYTFRYTIAHDTLSLSQCEGDTCVEGGTYARYSGAVPPPDFPSPCTW
jgi:hypothetical protein